MKPHFVRFEILFEFTSHTQNFYAAALCLVWCTYNITGAFVYVCVG